MDKIKNNFKKIIINKFFQIAILFLLIMLFYFVSTTIDSAINSPSKYDFSFIKTILGPILLVSLGISFGILFFQKKLDFKYLFIFIIILGIILRLIYSIDNKITERQHDVLTAYSNGHYGYTIYIFRYLKLPETNASQFYQPPLNSILQAFWMRFMSIFIRCPEAIKDSYQALFTTSETLKRNQTELINYLDTLYSSTKILSCFYSCISLIVIHYILNEFRLQNKYHNLILLFIACQPLMVMMAGTTNNDNLSYTFFFLSLLCLIKFNKNPTFKFAILLALSIGFGMLCKFSIGLVAIIYGPWMLYKFIKYIIENKENKKDILLYVAKLFVFGILVFPLGLSYATRNYLKFGQSFTYILDFGRSSWLHSNIKDRTIIERFISLPFSQLIHKDRGIYHDYYEYNVWVDLIKTSIFDEFSYGTIPSYPGTLMFICNIIICAIFIASFIYVIITLILKKYQQNIHLTLLSMAISLLGLISYVMLCIKMPYSCSSNFRYITYVAFSSICLITLVVMNVNKKWLTNFLFSLITTFVVSSCIFILII